MSVVLALGPNDSFVFDTPGGTTTNNLPEPLRDLEKGIGPGKPIVEVYCLEFGPNESYVFAGRNERGNIIRRNNLPPQLEAFLISPTSHTCIRDIPSLRISLGPWPSFFARDSTSFRWNALPPALEDAIQSRLGPTGWKNGAVPETVLLGEGGAFVYANACGGSSYALGNYPMLQSLISTLQGQNVNGHTGFALLQHVSLFSHSAPHFVAILHNAIPHFELPQTPSAALASMSTTFPSRSLPPIQAQPQAQPPPVYTPASPRSSVHSSPSVPTMMPKASPQPQSQTSPPLGSQVSGSSTPALPELQAQQQRPPMYTQQSSSSGFRAQSGATRPVGPAQHRQTSLGAIGHSLGSMLHGAGGGGGGGGQNTGGGGGQVYGWQDPSGGGTQTVDTTTYNNTTNVDTTTYDNTNVDTTTYSNNTFDTTTFDNTTVDTSSFDTSQVVDSTGGLGDFTSSAVDSSGGGWADFLSS